jgi:hypothetical protein
MLIYASRKIAPWSPSFANAMLQEPTNATVRIPKAKPPNETKRGYIFPNKQTRTVVIKTPYSLALTSGSAALASLFRVMFPVPKDSPKKITSTVKSSLYRREKGLGRVSRALS